MDVRVSGPGAGRALRPPGFSTGWRSLPWLTVQAVIAGTYRIDHAAGSETLPSGSLWFVPAGCRHRHGVVGGEAVQTVWWHAEVLLHGAFDAFAACGTPRVWPGGCSGALGAALRAQHGPAGRGALADALHHQARMCGMAAVLAEAVGGILDEPVPPALAPVFRFIEANLHLSMTRAELAARAGLAASRFHAVFLAATGAAPMSWVRRRRLARAAELLVGTDLGMEAVAARVGLCDAYHLNKRFRSAYGLPPTRFRMQARG